MSGTSNLTEISLLLNQCQQGQSSANEQLFAALYPELRRMAGGLMRGERVDHTLQPSAVVNEVCVRLLEQGVVDSTNNRRMLFGAAARIMQQILVDHARSRSAVKRGGNYERGSLDVLLDSFAEESKVDPVDLQPALQQLEQDSPRQHEVVMLRFYSGLTIAQVAGVVGVSETTVESDWRMARAKLFRAMQ